MPVATETINKAIIYFAPAFAIYSSVMAFFLYYNYTNPYAGFVIYISIFLFGGIFSYMNEKRLVPKLMEIETNAYYKSFAKKKLNGKCNYCNEKATISIYNDADYFKIQYDYYIKKTLLTQRMGSYFLFMLLGGVLLDISLKSVENQDNIFRTIVIMGTVSVFSTLLLMIALLKHAEYNAGCAVYRNAILATDISRTKFYQKIFLKLEFAQAIGWVLQNFRLKCPDTVELQEQYLNDG